MTASDRQVRIFESTIAKHREHWQSTLNPQQAAYLTACAADVASVEHAINEATTLEARSVAFADLLAKRTVAADSNDPREQAQEPWLQWQVAEAAGHILGDLRHALAEAATAHGHYVAAVRDGHREARARLLAEDEVTRLNAVIDQLQAALDANAGAQ